MYYTILKSRWPIYEQALNKGGWGWKEHPPPPTFLSTDCFLYFYIVSDIIKKYYIRIDIKCRTKFEMEHPPSRLGIWGWVKLLLAFFLFKLLNKVFWVTPSPNPQLGCFVYETIVVKSVIYLLDRNNPRAVLPKLGWVCSGLGFFFHLYVTWEFISVPWHC